MFKLNPQSKEIPKKKRRRKCKKERISGFLFHKKKTRTTRKKSSLEKIFPELISLVTQLQISLLMRPPPTELTIHSLLTIHYPPPSEQFPSDRNRTDLEERTKNSTSTQILILIHQQFLHTRLFQSFIHPFIHPPPKARPRLSR